MKERPILFSSPMVRAILAGRKTQTRRVVKPQPSGDPVSWPSAKCRSMVDLHEMRSLGPYGVPGDRLWVREAWQALHQSRDLETGVVDDVSWPAKIPTAPDDYWTLAYAATFGPMADETAEERGWPWRPGIHMPRWASRITLEIAEVRVERLHDISERDCWAEGIEELDGTFDDAEICAAAKRLGCSYEDARPTFALLWDAINGKPRPMLDDDGDPVLGDDERPIMVASASWDANPWVWVVAFRRLEQPA